MKSRCGKNVIWLTVYAVLWRYRTLASSIFLYAAHLDFALFIEDLHHKRDSFGYNKEKSSAGYGLAEKIKMSVAIWLGSAPFRDFLKKKGSKRRLTHDLLNPTHFDQPQY